MNTVWSPMCAEKLVEPPPVGEVHHDEKVQSPKMYKVILLNDNVTTVTFVIHVLIEVFHKPRQEAWQIMMIAHLGDSAVVGTYPKDVAETLVHQAQAMIAQHQGDPHRGNLRFTVEEE